MKFLNKFVKGFAAVVVSLLAAMLISSTAYAIPFTGDNTPPAPSPAFNVYTGVPVEGNESDFFRGKVEGDTNASVTDLRSTCETGKRFTLRVYVHNGASQDLNANGTGPSVAHGTKVKVDLKNATAASSFNPTANVSSISPALSVNDGMSITCTDGKTVDLSYVNGSAKQFTALSGSTPLSDSIVTSAGAAIGSVTPNGDVWGCWDQRVYVTLTVEVKEKPVVIPANAICKIENGTFAIIDNKKRTVRGTIKPEGLNNVNIVSYRIDWGDGSTPSTKQSDTHSYTNDGRYTIQASFVVEATNGAKFSDGTTRKTISGSNCTTVVEFKKDQPPVVVPPTVTPPTVTTLASTGPASMFSIFALTSIIGAVLHRVYTARRATTQQ